MKEFKYRAVTPSRFQAAPHARLMANLPRTDIELRAELTAARQLIAETMQLAERLDTFDKAAILERARLAEDRAAAVGCAVQAFANTLTAKHVHHPEGVPEWILDALEEILSAANADLVEEGQQ